MTSPLVRRPSLPVPVSPETSMRRSSAILRTAGDKGWTGGWTRRLDWGLDCGLAAGRAAGAAVLGGSATAAAAAPSAMAPRTAPTFTVSPGLTAIVCEDAGGRRRHFDGHLVGLELDHRFVGLDGLAFLLEPLADRRLGHRLAEGRHLDLDHRVVAFSQTSPNLDCHPRASSISFFSSSMCLLMSPVAVAADAGRPA